MRIGALRMFRIKSIATGDIAPSDDWWPRQASDQLGLAIADPDSIIVMSVLHARAVLALSRRAHHPSVHVTVR